MNYDELEALISPMASTDVGTTSGRGDEFGGGDLVLP